MHNPGIYVEIFIHANVDEVWRRTQSPEIHELWDLRFSSIRYLPKVSESDPQQFSYSTRIGLGLSIDGEGESTGSREDASGSRTSALKFWSADTSFIGMQKRLTQHANPRTCQEDVYQVHVVFGDTGSSVPTF